MSLTSDGLIISGCLGQKPLPRTLIPLIFFLVISHKLVIYGGAFNPPHLDHVGYDGVVGTLLASVAERVLIIPTGKREDKDYGDISDDHRLRLLELATEDFRD